MDPLTRAAQTFALRLAEVWRRDPVVRLLAAPEQRPTLLASLRLFEWAPDNHWPLCVVEAAADELDALADAAAAHLLADLARVRQGLADDGVTLVDPSVLADAPAGLDPLTRLRRMVERSGDALARTGVVAGLALVFVPAGSPVPKVMHRLAAALAAWPARPSVRLAVAVTDPAALADTVPALAALEVDDDEVDAYCRDQVERLAAAAPPAEASLRRHFLAASDAARRQDLPAARRAYLAAAAELVVQRRFAEAAVVQITLGGLAFGLADAPAALAHFDQAVAHGTTLGDRTIVAQAQLGAAGVLFASGRPGPAAQRYELAAGDGGPEALRIEALRMAGTCRLRLNDTNGAARAWQAAVNDASALPAATRQQTTWQQAGEALLALLQRRGQHAQATHLRALLRPERGPQVDDTGR